MFQSIGVLFSFTRISFVLEKHLQEKESKNSQSNTICIIFTQDTVNNIIGNILPLHKLHSLRAHERRGGLVCTQRRGMRSLYHVVPRGIDSLASVGIIERLRATHATS